jgi:hypothetical protein
MAGLNAKQQKLIVDALNNPGQLGKLKQERQTTFLVNGMVLTRSDRQCQFRTDPPMR